jgi:hypothetical protein
MQGMTMTDIAQQKAVKRGHKHVVLDHIGESSGRYKFVCVTCNCSLNFFEGEWFGQLLNQDCKEDK